MLIPVFLGAIVNTFSPSLLEIGNPFTVTFSKQSLMTLIGLMLFFCGTQMDFSLIRKVAKRGLPLASFKLICFILFGLIVISFMPKDGFLGISALAWITAYMSCNSALYLSIVSELGDETDQANFGLLTLIGMPNIPLLLFASGSGSELFKSMMAMILPFLIGILVTLLDNNLKVMFEKGTQCLIPIAGFAFGTNIHLLTVFNCGIQGMILCMIIMILSIIPCMLFDRFILHQSATAALASCGLSGVSLSLPYLAAQVNPDFSIYVETATAQCALVLVMTTFLLPFIAKLWHQRFVNSK